jgi:mono/diheme cytochrome c family protein
MGSVRSARYLLPIALFGGLLLAREAPAQRKPQAIGFPDAPGKQVLLDRCFQCHSPAMWMDHRQDRRGWESTLFRMVGRGALWSEDDIKAMADYLGKTYAKEPK